MLTCLPLGFCSWNYRVQGATQEAILTFDWLTEQGALHLGARECRIVKHGWTSGRWTLEDDTGVLAEAQKLSAFSRTMEIRAGEYTLTARGKMFSRQFTLESGGQSIGLVAPMHMFTRRARVECGTDVPEMVQLFTFWLVALMWKRDDESTTATTTTTTP